MSKYHFLFVVLAIVIGLGLGQEKTFGLRTALMGPKDQGRVEAVALSPDKETLVFASSYGYNPSTIYILEEKTGQTLWSTSGCGAITSMKFISDDSLFMRGSPLADGGGSFGCILNLNSNVPLQIQFFEGQDVLPHYVDYCPEDNPSDPYPYIGDCEALKNNGKLSLDLSLIARSVDDQTIAILDAKTLDSLNTLNLQMEVQDFTFSPDSKLLAVTHEDSSLTLWNTQTGLKVSTIEAKEPPTTFSKNRVELLSFSADGNFLLLRYYYTKKAGKGTQGEAAEVLWDIQNQRQHILLNEDTTHRLSNDGKFLFGVSKKYIEVWDIATAQKPQTFTSTYDLPVRLSTALEGTMLFAHYHRFWEDPGYILAWDLQTGEQKINLYGATALTVQDNIFLTGNNNGEAKIWDIATGKELQVFSSRYIGISSLKFSKDSKYIAGAVGPTANSWNIATGQRYEVSIEGKDDEVTFDMAFSNKGNELIISRGVDGYDEGFRTSIRFWSFEQNQLTTLIPPSVSESFYGYTPTGDYIIVQADRYQPDVSIFNSPVSIQDDKMVSPNGKFATIGKQDGTVELFNAKTSESLYIFSGHTAGRNDHEKVSIAFSLDGSYLATGGYADGKINIWETATGNLVKTLWSDEGNIRNLEFSPSGNFLITEYSTKKLWNISKEEIITAPIPEDEQDWWTSHTFSPNDALIATHGRNSIYLWNSNTGELVHTFNQSGNVAFSPDGKLLVIGSAFPGLNNAVSIFGAEDNSSVFLNADISYQDTLAKDDTELITNGSFSVGSAGWLLGNDVWAGNTLLNFNTSPGYAALGVSENGDRQDKSIGKLSQVITLPENAQKVTLSFWYSIITEETGAIVKDSLHCQLEQDTILASFDFSNLDAAKEYKEVRLEPLDVSAFAGQRLYLSCYAETDETYPTVFRLDDFSLRLE